MNERQKKFVREYMISGCAYNAALKSGYSENYAKAQSHKILENKGIKKEIEKRTEKIDKSSIASAQEIQEFLTRQMRGESEEECITTVGIGDGCSEVIKVKKEITPKDRQKAADTLAKITGLHQLNNNLTGEVKLVFSEEYND